MDNSLHMALEKREQCAKPLCIIGADERRRMPTKPQANKAVDNSDRANTRLLQKTNDLSAPRKGYIRWLWNKLTATYHIDFVIYAATKLEISTKKDALNLTYFTTHSYMSRKNTATKLYLTSRSNLIFSISS